MLFGCNVKDVKSSLKGLFIQSFVAREVWWSCLQVSQFEGLLDCDFSNSGSNPFTLQFLISPYHSQLLRNYYFLVQRDFRLCFKYFSFFFQFFMF